MTASSFESMAVVDAAPMIAWATHTSDTPVSSPAIDLLGVDQLVVIVGADTLTGALAVKLQTAATSGGSYADASPAIAMTDIAAGDDDSVHVWRINVKESTQLSRYVKVVITPDGAAAEADVKVIRFLAKSSEVVFSDTEAGTFRGNVQVYDGNPGA